MLDLRLVQVATSALGRSVALSSRQVAAAAASHCTEYEHRT